MTRDRAFDIRGINPSLACQTADEQPENGTHQDLGQANTVGSLNDSRIQTSRKRNVVAKWGRGVTFCVLKVIGKPAERDDEARGECRLRYD